MAAMVSSTIAFHLHLQSNGGNGHSDHNVAHHGQCEPSSKLILAGKCQLKRPLLTQTGEKVFPTNARKKKPLLNKIGAKKNQFTCSFGIKRNSSLFCLPGFSTLSKTNCPPKNRTVKTNRIYFLVCNPIA
jgi:hypothetical protein